MGFGQYVPPRKASPANCMAVPHWGTSPGVAIQAASRPCRGKAWIQSLDSMNHVARFLTDAETICKQIPREKIELLAEGWRSCAIAAGGCFCSASAAAPEIAATR